MHTLLDLGLILVTGCLFTLLVRLRPGARPIRLRGLCGLFIIGLVIGVIFLSTQSLYAPSSGI